MEIVYSKTYRVAGVGPVDAYNRLATPDGQKVSVVGNIVRVERSADIRPGQFSAKCVIVKPNDATYLDKGVAMTFFKKGEILVFYDVKLEEVTPEEV